MKKLLLGGLLAISLGGLLSGCGTLDKVLLKPQTTTIPPQVVSTNIVYKTNVVEVAASTNATTGVITPAVEQRTIDKDVQYVYSAPTVTTNWVANPTIAGGLNLASALPVPYVPLASTALGGLLAAYVAFRNKQTSVGLVKSVEAARDVILALPDGKNIDAQFTKVLSTVQDASGVLGRVNDLLEKHT